MCFAQVFLSGAFGGFGGGSTHGEIFVPATRIQDGGRAQPLFSCQASATINVGFV